MGLPGYGTDPVDREFDNLLRAAQRRPARQPPADGIPVSDVQFESLLTAFKSLNDSRDAGDATRTVEPGAPPPLPADSRAAIAATQLSRAWRDFASQPAIGQNPDLQQAVRRLECLTINLQLALPGTAAQAVLAVGAAGQSFALAPAQIVEVLDVVPASLARDGQRACIVTGAERLPLYFLRHWLVHGDLDETVGSHSRIVVVAGAGGRAGIVVDAVDGLLPVAVRPPGTLLRGTPGLKGMAVAGERALPLLDLAVLLGDAVPGRAEKWHMDVPVTELRTQYGAKDATAQN